MSFMTKKKYVKPEFRLIGSELESAQCVQGWAATSSSGQNNTCTSGPAANFLCNAGNWADTQCYSGFNAAGPAEPQCQTGNAAGNTCTGGTAAGTQNQPPVSGTCDGGFSPVEP